MKHPGRATLLLITSTRISRADFDGGLRDFKSVGRPQGEAVGAALALGGKAGAVWVLSEDVFEHRLALHAAQVMGLTAEQLGRAIAFEVEPFSGIAVTEGIAGYLRRSEGSFDVIELPRAALEGMARAAVSAGGRLAGVAHPGAVPAEPELQAWLAQMLSRLQSGELPIIIPPAPAPAANRFRVAAGQMAAVALVLLFGLGSWNSRQRAGLEKHIAEYGAASRALDAANKQSADLRKQLDAFEKEQTQRAEVTARRSALLSLLTGIAANRPEDIVVRDIKVDGPSSLIVSGLSLEADAPDELSIVLSQSLHNHGWTAELRSKTGKRNLANGGPWEFALTLTYEETSQGKPST